MRENGLHERAQVRVRLLSRDLEHRAPRVDDGALGQRLELDREETVVLPDELLEQGARERVLGVPCVVGAARWGRVEG